MDESVEQITIRPKRKWDRHIQYILAMIGSCVGTGNIWRFPYICNINGGGAFLIPFIFFITTCGFPLYLLEVSMGQFSGRSPVHAWAVCPLFQGIGYSLMLTSIISSIHIGMILVWTMNYIVRCFTATLPWTTCDNWWNTDSCTTYDMTSTNSSLLNYTYSGLPLLNYTYSGLPLLNYTYSGLPLLNYTYSGLPLLNYTKSSYTVNSSLCSMFDEDNIYCKNATTTPRTSGQEFWQLNVLSISDGLEYLGSFKWQSFIYLIVSFILVFLCLVKGVKSIGKVVYVTATLPYVLLVVLLIRGATLPGAVDGMLYYLKPDFSKLLEFKVWIEAAVQVFYSLGPCYGTLIVLSNHNPFHNNVLRDSIMLPIICEGTSLFGGLVLFTILGYLAFETGMDVSQFVASGPGFGFVVYPQALSKIPLPQFWCLLFFITLYAVVIDTLFSLMEVPITCCIDYFPKYFHGKRKIIFKVCFVATYFLIDILLCTQGGMYIFQLIDWYSCSMIYFIGFFECLVFGWIYGTDRFGDDIKMMIGRRPPVIYTIFWKFITPVILVFLTVVSFMAYAPPVYGDYKYSKTAEIVGLLYSVIPMIPVPIIMFKVLYQAKGSFIQRLKSSVKPGVDWRVGGSKAEQDTLMT